MVRVHLSPPDQKNPSFFLFEKSSDFLFVASNTAQKTVKATAQRPACYRKNLPVLFCKQGHAQSGGKPKEPLYFGFFANFALGRAFTPNKNFFACYNGERFLYR